VTDAAGSGTCKILAPVEMSRDEAGALVENVLVLAGGRRGDLTLLSILDYRHDEEGARHDWPPERWSKARRTRGRIALESQVDFSLRLTDHAGI
jgi:hypothetical protein